MCGEFGHSFEFAARLQNAEYMLYAAARTKSGKRLLKEIGLGRPGIRLKDDDNRRALIIEAKKSDSKGQMENDDAARSLAGSLRIIKKQ